MKKIFKKSLAIMVSAAICLTALIGCLSVSAANGTGTFTVGSDTGKPGELVTVPIELAYTSSNGEDGMGIAASLFDVSFDTDALTITDIAAGEDATYTPDLGDVPGGEDVPPQDIYTVEYRSTDGETISVVDGAVRILAMPADNETVLTSMTVNLTFTINEGAAAQDYAITITEQQTCDYGQATPDGFGSFTYADNEEFIDMTITNGKITVVADAPVKNITFGHTLQLKTIEPWGIFFNAIIRLDGQTIDYSTLNDYGAYILRADDYEGVEAPTKDELVTSLSAKKYDKNSPALSFVDDNTRIQITYDESLYTYEMSKELYVVFYAEDENGVLYYGDVKTRSMAATIQTYLDNASLYNDETIALCQKMVAMFEKTTAYRNAHTGTTDRNLITPDKINEYTEFGTASDDVAYTFGHTMQLTTIEPWGITFNGIVRLNGTAIDYSTCSDYGLIVYPDVDKKYSEAPTLSQLLSEQDTLVYSKLNEGATLNGDRISIDYAEGIYTYQMDNNLYASFYVVIDGKYYYGDVRTRSMVSVIDQYFAASSSYEQDLLDLLTAMKELFDATTAYRALYQ